MAFCRNCGAQLGDGDGLCPNCGQTADAPTTRSGGAAVSRDIIGNLITYFKDFFSKNVIGGAQRALSSSGYEGPILLGLFFFVFALSIPVYLHETFASIIKRSLGAMASSGISETLRNLLPFWALLGLSFLVALICIVVIFCTLFLHINFALKKNVSIMSILNLVGYSMIPVIIALLVNMLFGLITPFIPVITLCAAVFMQTFVLISTIRELNGSENSNMFMYTLFFTACFTLIALFSYLIYNGFITKNTEKILTDFLF